MMKQILHSKLTATKKALALLLMTASSSLFGDVVILRTGEKIQGNISAQTPDSITISTAEGSKVIPKDKIKRMAFGDDLSSLALKEEIEKELKVLDPTIRQLEVVRVQTPALVVLAKKWEVPSSELENANRQLDQDRKNLAWSMQYRRLSGVSLKQIRDTLRYIRATVGTRIGVYTKASQILIFKIELKEIKILEPQITESKDLAEKTLERAQTVKTNAEKTTFNLRSFNFSIQNLQRDLKKIHDHSAEVENLVKQSEVSENHEALLKSLKLAHQGLETGLNDLKKSAKDLEVESQNLENSSKAFETLEQLLKEGTLVLLTLSAKIEQAQKILDQNKNAANISNLDSTLALAKKVYRSDNNLIHQTQERWKNPVVEPVHPALAASIKQEYDDIKKILTDENTDPQVQIKKLDEAIKVFEKNVSIISRPQEEPRIIKPNDRINPDSLSGFWQSPLGRTLNPLGSYAGYSSKNQLLDGFFTASKSSALIYMLDWQTARIYTYQRAAFNPYLYSVSNNPFPGLSEDSKIVLGLSGLTAYRQSPSPVMFELLGQSHKHAEKYLAQQRLQSMGITLVVFVADYGFGKWFSGNAGTAGLDSVPNKPRPWVGFGEGQVRIGMTMALGE